MYQFFGKTISGPFTIPSGIVCTTIPVLKRIMSDVPEVGILTTKSIGPAPRVGNREPIFLQFGVESFINAVGLTNPGAEEYARELEEVEIPDDKFLLASIFGATPEEFAFVAEKLEHKVDGFELNVSCPNVKGFGDCIGADSNFTADIVKAVKKFGKPVLVKVSPNVSMNQITELVKACEEAGADGFVGINTTGPGVFTVDGKAVLTNKTGGVSGEAVFPEGIRVTQTMRAATKKPILAMGGIRTRQHVVEYEKAGANFYGVGSALTGMDTEELKTYFRTLSKDLAQGTDVAEDLIKKQVNMRYRKITISNKEDLSDDLTLLTFDTDFPVYSFSRYVFFWIPGIGEKPFSVFSDKPLQMFIQKVGQFTSEAMKLKIGDEVYIRGPYGKPVELSGKVLVVAGGSGIGSIGMLRKNEKITCKFLFGCRMAGRIPVIDEFKDVKCATDDGSEGHKGFVTELVPDAIQEFQPDYIVNCGPKVMSEKAEKIEMEAGFDRTKIFTSLDELTMCGVGICGRCARTDGLRTCIDGPFLNPTES